MEADSMRKYLVCRSQNMLNALLRSTSGSRAPARGTPSVLHKGIFQFRSIPVPSPTRLSLVSEHAHTMSEWRHILQQSRQEICRPGSGEVCPDWLWPSSCGYLQV